MFNTSSEEAAALATAESITKAFGFAEELFPLVIIHEPASETHVACMVPNRWRFIVILLL